MKLMKIKKGLSGLLVLALLGAGIILPKESLNVLTSMKKRRIKSRNYMVLIIVK